LKLKKSLISVFAIILVISLTMTTYAAPPNGNNDKGWDNHKKEDNKPDPLTTKQLDLKKQALKAKINGKAKGKTYKVAKGQYVELEREGEHAIWTVLGEFADLQHNTIPEPDRSVNNTTMWTTDFSREYYMNLLFDAKPNANSMRNYYIEQSSNRFSVNGDVTDWIQVPGNAATYDDNPDTNVWNFLKDSVNGWYSKQIAAGKTAEQINEYLSQFDKWDRYDYDGDGNFDELDGYIDTFQSVHAGEGEDAGAPATAIWSHSWYAFENQIGITGPELNKLGGIQIGGSNFWVGKYTI
jgi:immune inhibitor A